MRTKAVGTCLVLAATVVGPLLKAARAADEGEAWVGDGTRALVEAAVAEPPTVPVPPAPVPPADEPCEVTRGEMCDDGCAEVRARDCADSCADSCAESCAEPCAVECAEPAESCVSDAPGDTCHISDCEGACETTSTGRGAARRLARGGCAACGGAALGCGARGCGLRCGLRGCLGCCLHRGEYIDRWSNCNCDGSYKFPVPPLYTYHWPGLYSQQLMTDYHSPLRFPPLRPYTDESPILPEEQLTGHEPSAGVRPASYSAVEEASPGPRARRYSVADKLERLYGERD